MTVLGGNGIAAGVLLCVAFSVVPAFAAMTAADYVEAHQLLGRRYDAIMPPIVIGSVLADVVLAVLTEPTAARVTFAAAAALLAGVALISQTRNVPINKRVKALDPAAVGPEWPDPRRLWRGWHLLRTALALAALVATASGVVLG
ncbi:DUF1772 domain-containing protein [Wenjunlia tyrosinilytica]|uniref:DUF1772 domain-containing protein n=1 Tax=Wenjunlia tyrosinilytica TaxID=1544741 RepID=UPI001E4DC7F6|nr:DUF1772 domain-containing protein [Wenjunlia tyrosinilytica]